MLSGTIWIIFFRPAVVLYYRAEIQLRTFLEPQTALETFKHLTRKYPDYRYIDSVRYRMAWIQDRRLNLHQKAAASYQVFLKQHNKSVWIDEALVNLVRLYVDCLQKPEMGLETIDRYEKKFPSGVFLPHMQLYKIRALAQKIQITNSEDRLIELLDFSEAIKAEITANANLQ
jgi:outer membrane protein assembly factor BamD (BamD/ComL family)